MIAWETDWLGGLAQLGPPDRIQGLWRRSMGKAGPTKRFAMRANRFHGSRGGDPDAGWRAECRLGTVATLAARRQPTRKAGPSPKHGVGARYQRKGRRDWRGCYPRRRPGAVGAGAAGFPRQRMSVRHRAPGTNCFPSWPSPEEKRTLPRDPMCPSGSASGGRTGVAPSAASQLDWRGVAARWRQISVADYPVRQHFTLAEPT